MASASTARTRKVSTAPSTAVPHPVVSGAANATARGWTGGSGPGGPGCGGGAGGGGCGWGGGGCGGWGGGGSGCGGCGGTGAGSPADPGRSSIRAPLRYGVTAAELRSREG